MPLLFVYTPILFQGPLWQVAETTVTALLGLFTLAAFFEGFHLRPLGWWERALLLLATTLLLWPGYAAHGVGAAIFVALCFWQKIHVKTARVLVKEYEK